MKNLTAKEYITYFQADKCIFEVLPKIQSAFDAKLVETARFFHPAGEPGFVYWLRYRGLDILSVCLRPSSLASTQILARELSGLDAKLKGR
jgi:hypothetical protein